ncbi:MAG: 23S rRNA (pseudouridine(1915)-N(3))-methyltransferase RlmH [Eubacteriales bacterium]|nr:23S rRNA (pseudouridine(1915)-N(3))-methyltransferase RlmH [Eubacteriales bacterium]
MSIIVLSVGKIKEKYFNDAIKEYLKRISRFTKVEVIEIKDEPEPKNASPAQIERTKQIEGERLLSKITPDDFVIALAIKGEELSSESFAERIKKALDSSRRIVFLIGGSNGLAENVLSRANRELSFSSFTFPHQLMRVILLEQLYRACKINANERYHK